MVLLFCYWNIDFYWNYILGLVFGSNKTFIDIYTKKVESEHHIIIIMNKIVSRPSSRLTSFWCEYWYYHLLAEIFFSIGLILAKRRQESRLNWNWMMIKRPFKKWLTFSFFWMRKHQTRKWKRLSETFHFDHKVGLAFQTGHEWLYFRMLLFVFRSIYNEKRSHHIIYAPKKENQTKETMNQTFSSIIIS